MVRRSQFLTQKIEWANDSCIVVSENRENGDYWTHEFRIEKDRLLGLNTFGVWVAVSKGHSNWKRRMNLLFKPPENVTLFQAIRENGKWRGARTKTDRKTPKDT